MNKITSFELNKLITTTKLFSKIKLTATSKLVLRCLIDYWNNEIGYCYPKQETISQATGVSRKSVVTAIRELAKLNLIKTQKKKYHIEYFLGEKLFHLLDLRCELFTQEDCKKVTSSCEQKLQLYKTNKEQIKKQEEKLILASPIDDYNCAIHWLNSLSEEALKLPLIREKVHQVKEIWKI